MSEANKHHALHGAKVSTNTLAGEKRNNSFFRQSVADLAVVKIGIVASRFNEEITSKMLETALAQAKELGVEVLETVKVEGAFEISFAVKQLLKNNSIQGVATLGAVIKGETDHDQVIAHSTAKKLLDLSIEFDKPVSLGIIGPNVSREQAEKRAVKYAKRSVQAVVGLLG